MPKIRNQNLTQSTAQFHPQTITSPPLPNDLTFPLNVYAHAWQLQKQASSAPDQLSSHCNIRLQAIEHFSFNLLTARLPMPPCRILEVGIASDQTVSLLTGQGYEVQHISPDSYPLIHAKRSLETDNCTNNYPPESCEASFESFDVLLFQESVQHIDPLTLFNEAVDLLPLLGDLIFIDEFALKYDESGSETLYLLKDLLALAGRFGFELLARIDLSCEASTSIESRLHLCALHRGSLIRDLGLTAEQLTKLDDSNQIRRKLYARQHYGYALIHLRKKTIPQWRLRTMEKTHAPEMLSLFKKTFHQEMTQAFWKWKYGSNSAHALSVWEDHQLIAHYGGVSRQILYFGQPKTAVQIADVMVDSSKRGIFTKKGALFLMMATFLERYIGYGKSYFIGFGFPNDRHMKVAELLGLYAEVGYMVEFSWGPRSRFPLWQTRLQLLDQAPANSLIIHANECWQRMAADLQDAIIGIRNWEYLSQRYLSHPTHHYQILLIKNRFGGKARGILVLRFDPEGCEIIDFIAPLAEIPLLVEHARRLASLHGAIRVFCRITENFAHHFAATGGIQHPVNIRIPTNVWSEGPPLEILKNHWWLMSGDMDFR